MRISIFGLGYVGLVNAVCLACEGHEVFGVDVNPQKVQMVNEGKSPIIEEQVEDMLAEQVRKGRIHATVIPAEAVSRSQVTLICVGTPSVANGSIDLNQVKQVCKQIGTTLRHTDSPHTVVIRSTMLPGNTHRMARLLSNYSARSLGQGLYVAYNPEFLREGSAVRDFYSPPYILVGTDDPVAADVVTQIYGTISAPLFLVDVMEAEFAKYASNAFHAAKITFANEIGRLARSWGIDGYKVMDILCQDNVLNISSAYLRPGLAYGGSCLPKDLRALMWKARLSNVSVPLLESLSWSNRLQIEHAYELISQSVKNIEDTIGLLGLAFKAGTDDLRESPMVEVAERLIGKGYRLLLYDEKVCPDQLMGSNKEFIEQQIPHLAELMANDINQVIKESRVLVVGQFSQYADALQGTPKGTVIINLEYALNRRNAATRRRFHQDMSERG